jgi:hypothetical protein
MYWRAAERDCLLWKRVADNFDSPEVERVNENEAVRKIMLNPPVELTGL